MPANLTPDYHRAEERFRHARTVEEKIDALEEMLRVVPKHKGTDGLQGDLKARLAKLKKQPASKAGKATHSHLIPREGAGQVALVGPPNTGKSSLVAALTKAKPEIAPYPFTTREPHAGMMDWEDVRVQLIDTPPITADYLESYLSSTVQVADAALLMVDLGDDDGPFARVGKSADVGNAIHVHFGGIFEKLIDEHGTFRRSLDREAHVMVKFGIGIDNLHRAPPEDEARAHENGIAELLGHSQGLGFVRSDAVRRLGNF